MNPILSVVILNYNTKDLTLGCLESLWKVKREINFEIIVVDNASTDGSIEELNKLNNLVKLVKNSTNLGFAKGNNAARNYCDGKYVLFLNSDTIMDDLTLKKSVKYLESNLDVGALTCKTVLPNGKFDKDARRSFPTPWVAISHFSGLDHIFPKSKIFAQYWYGYIPEDIEHEIDVMQGAFFMVRKEILDKVDWFSEEYFLDGEDIDLSWKIKSLGCKLVYYPEASIIHLKKATKRKTKNVFVNTGVESMAIFYKKFLWEKYPFFINYLVLFAIKLLKLLRNIKGLVQR